MRPLWYVLCFSMVCKILS